MLPALIADRLFSGIMQLALLARCGNIASSVITSSGQKTVSPPKIHITDENERTVSYHSETAIVPAETGEAITRPCLTAFKIISSHDQPGT